MLRYEHRQADQQRKNDEKEKKSAATAHAGDIWKLPYLSEPDRSPRRSEDEPDPRRPVFLFMPHPVPLHSHVCSYCTYSEEVKQTFFKEVCVDIFIGKREPFIYGV